MHWWVSSTFINQTSIFFINNFYRFQITLTLVLGYNCTVSYSKTCFCFKLVSSSVHCTEYDYFPLTLRLWSFVCLFLLKIYWWLNCTFPEGWLVENQDFSSIQWSLSPSVDQALEPKCFMTTYLFDQFLALGGIAQLLFGSGGFSSSGQCLSSLSSGEDASIEDGNDTG